ncbi:sugar ABC transporter permease [Halodesulfovibrio spirochaetisodalis]|uniref:Sugar ABC transporter permease n=2 Tax=Halodesulfovibrio spirochaetisodalis TaxID=1560234 RepID=A0A1B7XDK7_9BACT|nr:sugar ABC transporter permease [Halodesulfovibrio spirochaetisodalis]
MRHFSYFLRHALLAAGALFMATPFIVMLSTALKSQANIFSGSFSIIPEQWAASGNFGEVFTSLPIIQFMLNGALVTATIFCIQVLVAVPCAYALAKFDFKGRNILFNCVLWSLLIPPQAVAIPVFLELHSLGLLNSYSALILPWTISVLGIFLMRQFFMAIPDDIMDAARMDGMGEISILIRIMLPMAVPALTAFGILSFIAHWNDFFWPLICLQDVQYFTPPLGIAYFKTDDAGIKYGPLMAAACVITIPLLVVFLAARDKFIQGVSVQAGVK